MKPVPGIDFRVVLMLPDSEATKYHPNAQFYNGMFCASPSNHGMLHSVQGTVDPKYLSPRPWPSSIAREAQYRNWNESCTLAASGPGQTVGQQSTSQMHISQRRSFRSKSLCHVLISDMDPWLKTTTVGNATRMPLNRFNKSTQLRRPLLTLCTGNCWS